MESILGVTFPKGDLEVLIDWLKFSDSFAKNK
jgi:hypothetical protein